jgi:PAS domain S-box-containing protein
MSVHFQPQPVSKPRKSGIDVLGDIPWGSHFCVFYETTQDLLDVLVPYFKAGLESNEFNIWVVTKRYFGAVEEAVAALGQAIPNIQSFLETGRLEIVTEADFYLRGNDFNWERLLNVWKEKIAGALARGFDGIRASGDVSWLGQEYWNDIYAYEKRLHELIAGQPAIILCSYPLPKFGGAEVLDIVQAHQFTIGRRQGKWELIESPTLVQAGGEMKKITELLQVKKEPAPGFRGMSYLVAVMSVAVALIVAKKLVADAPVSLFLCATMFSARYGGTRPGLLAMVLSLLAFVYFFLRPPSLWTISLEEWSRFLIFALSSLFVVLLVAAQTNAARSLRRAYDILTVTIRKLRETNGALRQEIRERKQAEDELRPAYQRLTYHVENTPLAVIEFDKDLTIKRWSGRAEEIFGWKASEALLKNINDPDFQIIYEEDQKAVKKINEELMQGAVNRNLSLNRNYTKYGEVIHCEWHNSVLRDGYGNVITILSLVHDVSERKKAEETLNRSYEEIRRLSNHLQNIREEERSHIAREIHDELGQQLTVLKMNVLGLKKKLTGADTAIHEKIGEITDLLDTTVCSVRRISSELRPSLLYNLGLVAAIEWQLREFEKGSGIKTVLIEPAEELKISDSVKNGLFRIFQESLTNAARHANASKIIVSLEQSDGHLILTVEDNGKGFEQDRIGSKQTLGILGMKERCQMMGGNFEIRSDPAKGTAVIAAVPTDGKN